LHHITRPHHPFERCRNQLWPCFCEKEYSRLETLFALLPRMPLPFCCRLMPVPSRWANSVTPGVRMSLRACTFLSAFCSCVCWRRRFRSFRLFLKTVRKLLQMSYFTVHGADRNNRSFRGALLAWHLCSRFSCKIRSPAVSSRPHPYSLLLAFVRPTPLWHALDRRFRSCFGGLFL
jgi:hypothetical protein